MKLYDGKKWRLDCLDHHRSDADVRIRPTRWLVLEELDEANIVPERSVRRVVDYARQIGPVRLVRKVGSRLKERRRTSAVCACGIGEIVEGDEDELGQWVVFFAGSTAPGLERIVVDRRFVRPTEPLRGSLQWLRNDGLTPFWRDWTGWHPMSGVDPGDTSDLLDACDEALRRAVTNEVFDGRPTEISEIRARPRPDGVRHVTIFGWGHHARTQIVPALPSSWAIERVHELDPALEESGEATWDTSGELRPGQSVDVVCIAGFHHTHAATAAEALRRGGDVIVEKPAVTTERELEVLLDAWQEPSRLHVLFQKRYGTIARHLRDDLDGPVDMHATVFEIPLPERHWYNWPNSAGRIVSNGCHWIDQFHWLNRGAKMRRATAERGPRGQISATLTLDNGAYFSLTLTDRGSARRGTREMVEYRCDDRTARVIDDERYTCEDGERLIRSIDVHPLESLEAAYRTIFERIAAGEPGDSQVSLVATHRSMLELAHLAQREE